MVTELKPKQRLNVKRFVDTTAYGSGVELEDRLERLERTVGQLRLLLDEDAWLALRRVHDHKGTLSVYFGCLRFMIDHAAAAKAIEDAWEVFNEYDYEIHYAKAE